jgi:hypothetical protein
MPLDTSGYSGFSIRLGPADVETPQALEIRVDPAANNGADLTCIYTSVLRFAAIGESENAWLRGSLVGRLPTLGRQWSSISRGPGWTGFRGATAVLSLASIFNAGVANFAGWAVDAAIVEPMIPIGTPEPDDHLQIQALLAVRDVDGILIGSRIKSRFSAPRSLSDPRMQVRSRALSARHRPHETPLAPEVAFSRGVRSWQA